MDEIKKEIEKLKNEAVALKQQNEREYRGYGNKIRVLVAEVKALTKDKENLEEYLAGKVVAEKKKVKEAEDKQIKQLNKADELVNESLAKKNTAQIVLDSANDIANNTGKKLTKRIDAINEKEKSVLFRSEKVADKEAGVNVEIARLDARDKQQDVRSEHLHKESHEGVKKLKEIVIKEKIVKGNLEAIEAKQKDAQEALWENNLVLEQTQKVRKDIGEKQYLISGKEELIANKEKKLEEEKRKLKIASSQVKATIIKLDARRENLNTMYKKFKEGGN